MGLRLVYHVSGYGNCAQPAKKCAQNNSFDAEAMTAAKTEVSYVVFLAHLVDAELAVKIDRSIMTRISKARLPALRRR